MSTDWIKLPFINKSEVCRRLYGVADGNSRGKFTNKLAERAQPNGYGRFTFSEEEKTRLDEIKKEILRELD